MLVHHSAAFVNHMSKTKERRFVGALLFNYLLLSAKLF